MVTKIFSVYGKFPKYGKYNRLLESKINVDKAKEEINVSSDNKNTNNEHF